MKDTKLTHSDLYPIVEILSQYRSVYNFDELDLVVDQLVNSTESLETITLSACFADGQTEVVLGDMNPGTDVLRCLGATDQRPYAIVDPRSAHTVHFVYSRRHSYNTCRRNLRLRMSKRDW